MTATRCKMDSRLIALFSNCISKNRQRINKKKANNKWQSLWQKYANSNNSKMKDWQRRRRRWRRRKRRRPCAHLKPCEEEVRADSANMLLLFYWKSFFSPPRTAGPHSHPHPRHAYTSPHSSFLLASTHHSLTHSASGRFELRAASNSTLQYALGRMEKWATGLK